MKTDKKKTVKYVIIIVWVIAAFLFLDQTFGLFGRGTSFKKCTVLFDVENKNRVKTNVYMLYENESKGKHTLHLYYPIHSGNEQVYPDDLNIETVTGDMKLSLLFPGAKEVVEGKINSQVSFKPHKFSKNDGGVFLNLEMAPMTSAIVKASFTQTLRENSYKNLFIYNFTMNAGWNKPLEEAAYIVRYPWENINLQVKSQANNRKYAYRYPLENATKEPPEKSEQLIKNSDENISLEVLTYRARDYLDRGLTIFIQEEKDKRK